MAKGKEKPEPCGRKLGNGGCRCVREDTHADNECMCETGYYEVEHN